MVVSLKKVYGLNKAKINLIIKKLGFSKNLKVLNLSSDQIFKLIVWLKIIFYSFFFSHIFLIKIQKIQYFDKFYHELDFYSTKYFFKSI